MSKKPLMGAFLFALLLGISPLVYARIHFPFFGHHHHKNISQSTQVPSGLARADEPGMSPYKSGWDTGYKKGYDGGQADHARGSKFDRDDAPGYKEGHSFCESLEGRAEHQCRKAYRLGFKLGYQDGYSGLQSRLMTSQESVPAQAAVPEQTPSQPEIQSQPQEPSTAMQETPSQPSTNEVNQPPANETAKNQPSALPRTASPLPLFGLFGFIGIALSLLSRAIRKVIQT